MASVATMGESRIGWRRVEDGQKEKLIERKEPIENRQLKSKDGRIYIY